MGKKDHKLIVTEEFICNEKKRKKFSNTIYACGRSEMGIYCCRCPAVKSIKRNWKTKKL